MADKCIHISLIELLEDVSSFDISQAEQLTTNTQSACLLSSPGFGEQKHPSRNMGETYRPAWAGSRASISHGLSFAEAAQKHVRQTFKANRVYILASASLAANTDNVQKLQNALGSKVAGMRIGMKPHTLWSECLEITEDARKADADLILTLGGGSLIDAAKIIALTLANDVQDSDGLLNLTNSSTSSANVKAPTIPIICIPTTLSGGEFNDRAGGTNDATKQKHSFSGPIRGPQLVILDPELTTSTPDKWWLSTGIRAVDHCVEAMCSLKGSEQGDRYAAEGLGRLFPDLLRCLKDGRDLEARLQCQLAVISAVKAARHAHMGASHGIGHQLGPLGVGHGETSCILLPAVCRYNKSANEDRQRDVCRIIWKDADTRTAMLAVNRKLTELSDLADMLDAYFRVLGMPRSLREVGVGEDEFAELAKTSLTDRHLPDNPIPITSAEQVLQILRIADNF